MQLVARVLDVLQELNELVAIGEDDATSAPVFTGTLSSFDRFPLSSRQPLLQALVESGLYEEAFPEVFRAALLSYDNLPGRWLLEHLGVNEKFSDPAQHEAILRPVVFDSIQGQSDVATKAKIMVVRSYLQAGKLHVAPHIARDWFPILAKYPDSVTESERSRIEPAMRAAYLNLAMLGSEEGIEPRGLTWARDFWQQNWHKFGCERTSVVDPPGSENLAGSVGDAHRKGIQELSRLTQEALSISERVDPNLYLPDKHEVLTGLVFRQIESVHSMVNSPALWHIDQAAGITRGLIETRIVLKWMPTQDPEIYLRFKEYGRGKLKLYKLHMEELRDSLDHTSGELDAEIEHLQSLVNGDVWEEFQDIKIAGNFASVDTRRMAERVGLLDDYRLIFSPASAAVHGEWGPISQHTLGRCANPMHRGHRIPSLGSRDISSFSVEFALGILESLIGDYRAAVEPVHGG
ncbi:hypothetical protein J7E83_12400 [Arthrobacter sp. ISL-48]|uniref:DUF5677 domain-containing protein n=1 Tax=Arthrobacter sp. ISL-48 TaxID=2819110 RepID=UPI001BE7A9A4|nr:DUF5677 domain-containing protein [Arthrobacter sp. ISL-48]MBT2532907.1 hypothetical protein [Arthrobacter sp. ISL-48]